MSEAPTNDNQQQEIDKQNNTSEKMCSEEMESFR